MEKKRILVLCTGNSCRSQMAEGYLRHFAGVKGEIYSAGIETHGLNLQAVSSMLQDGIDISSHTSNHVDEYAHLTFDFIITVCDHANEACPTFPSYAKKIHCNFPDPSKAMGSPVEIEAEFVRVRNSIKHFCKVFVEQNL